PVIWTYYGYPDLAKIAGEVVEPSRTLPRVPLAGLAATAVLYLALNAAFLHVLTLERIAASNLVAADVMDTLVGARGGALVAGLALLVVLASLNGNVFVTPRVLFGLARDGLAPGALGRVNAGGTPWVAMLAIGVFAIALAATGTFELLLGLAIVQVLVIDSWAVIGLFRLRRRDGPAPFSVPGYPWLPLLFVAVYAALFAGTVRAQPTLVAAALGMLLVAYGLSWSAKGGDGNGRHGAPARLPPCAALSLGHAPPRDRAAPPHQGRLRRQSAEDRRRAGADREARSAGGPGGVSRDRHVRLFRRRGRPGRGGDGGDAVPRSHGRARGRGSPARRRRDRVLRGLPEPLLQLLSLRIPRPRLTRARLIRRRRTRYPAGAPQGVPPHVRRVRRGALRGSRPRDPGVRHALGRGGPGGDPDLRGRVALALGHDRRTPGGPAR